MRVLIAPQEFKGSLTAVEVAEAMRLGVLDALADAEVDVLPMADGGPGTLDALNAARGGTMHHTASLDPLMRSIDARWLELPDGLAVIECAEASGLWRLRDSERDPRITSTYGTGLQVRSAVAAGCSELIIGLGGSATNDGGAGLAQALGYRLLDDAGADLLPGGAALIALDRIARPAEPLSQIRVTGACDVTNPLTGPGGASIVYGPQKGASTAVAEQLDTALARFAGIIKRDLGAEVEKLPRAGAAGGLGAGLVAFLGATLVSGAEVVGDAAGLSARISNADIVFTGEGRADRQTLFGKTPAHVARLARTARKPVICVAGSLGEGHEALLDTFDSLTATQQSGLTVPNATLASQLLRDATKRAVLAFVAV